MERLAMVAVPQDAGPGYPVEIGWVFRVSDGLGRLPRITDEAAKSGFAVVTQELDAGPTAVGPLADLTGDAAPSERIDHNITGFREHPHEILR